MTILDSPRAGGKYGVTDSVSVTLEDLNEQQKLVLTTWLCDQRRLGVLAPMLDSYKLPEIITRPRLQFSQRVERTLLFIAKHAARIDSTFTLGRGNPTEWLVAESESLSIDELANLLVLMHEMELLKGNVDTRTAWRLSPRGWLRVEELSARAVDRTQGFVAMWFNEDVRPAWTNGIEPAVKEAGYKPLRIDTVEHSGKVDDRIIAEIRRSRFLVADFSCEPKQVRGGVYYEAGFAEGLSIPIFWTVRQSSVDDLHFDTRQYNHIVWTNPDDLREKLTNRIRAQLGQGPLKSA